MKRAHAFWLAVVLVVLSGLIAAAEPQYATGVVFHDTNYNGIRDATEPGLAGVTVSDGRACVLTDANGKYTLPVSDDSIIFVVKPQNWMTAVNSDNLPRFYYIHKPNGSPPSKYKGVDSTGPLPASIDFPLYPHPEPDSFDVILFADTQPGSIGQVYYIGHDLVEELAGTNAAFGITLGNIVGDNLSLYPILSATIGRIGIPWYYVKGNHDTNYDNAPIHNLTDETFERVFGPSHYSFDYGRVHFVVLNNPYFGYGSNYTAQLDMRQMTFLRNDLSLVPKDKLVVLLMHIPIMQMSDRQRIYRLLEGHPHNLSISGHTHTQEHHFITSSDGWIGDKPHHHFICGTASGSWWSGAPDEVGIPHATMWDGTPNGYSIITFRGNEYSIRFKAARRPADYQMNIFAPEMVKSSEADKTEVLVNVFSGSECSKVYMRLGEEGEWVEMKRAEENDPYYLFLKEIEKSINPPPGYKKLPDVRKSTHIWKCFLPANPTPGTYLIYVRTTDMFNQTFTSRRLIHIE